MRKLMKNRTSFVIAHRLSTIVDADLILLMQDGNIIEQGDHKTLLQAGKACAELYNSQFVWRYIVITYTKDKGLRDSGDDKDIESM